jgi:hypothetical protein
MSNHAITYVNRLIEEGYVYTMEHAGFSASLMKARKLSNRDGLPHSLPPGQKMPVVPVSCLPGCPSSWSREPGTYVCPVDTDWGIWFDFTMNDTLNTAVVPSVKGMNPITGRPLNGPCLEAYVEKCPVHDEPFGHDRLCEKCGFRWPAQNYLTHESTLWLDGFRQPDGTVRQFFFTDDDKRDIASIVMGSENTMPAFGFVFYEPKERRRSIASHSTGSMSGSMVSFSYTPYSDVLLYNDNTFDECGLLNTSTSVGHEEVSASYTCSTQPPTASASNSRGISSATCYYSKSVKEASVGAGAEIRQDIRPDTLGIDGWKDAPSSIIRLYFCFEEQLRQIVEVGGVSGVQTKKSGFMDGMPVG